MPVKFKYNEWELGYDTVIGSPPPEIQPLKLDKLSLTMDVPEHDRIALHKNLEAMVKGQYAKSKYMKRYNYSYQVSTHETAVGGIGKMNFHLGIKPYSEDVNYLRLEFNPSKTNPAFVQNHLNLLIPDGYHRLMTEGRVTRIDEAVDVFFVKLEQLLLKYPAIQIAEPIIEGDKPVMEPTLKSGRIIGLRLGAKAGEKRFLIYDKTKQLGDVETKTLTKKGTSAPEPKPCHEIMRIEYQYRPKKKNLTLTEAKAIPDPFKKLDIYAALDDKDVFDSKTYRGIWRMFQLNCFSFGLQSAWANLPKDYEKLFKPVLEKHRAIWWKPDTLTERAKAINRIMKPQLSPKGFPEYFQSMEKLIDQPLDAEVKTGQKKAKGAKESVPKKKKPHPKAPKKKTMEDILADIED